MAPGTAPALENEFYDSAACRSSAWEELRQVIRYRDLIFQLIRRELITRYKRSFLGMAWTILNPLGMMVVLSVAFSQVFSATPAYAAYVLSGLIAWNFFSQTTSQAMYKLIWGSDLMKRIYLPRTAFAIAETGAGLVNLSIAVLPLLGVMLFEGLPVSWTILFLPVPMLLLAVFALGLGLLLSTLAVYFPDLVEMYQIILMAWLYLSPVIYPEQILDPALRSWLAVLNPLWSLVRLFRLPVYDGILPAWSEIWPPAVVGLVFLALAWIVFTRKADEFAYRI